jgi:hypothetical protein
MQQEICLLFSSHKTTRLINPKNYRVGMAINDYVRGGAALLSGIALVSQLALPAKALGEDLYRVATTPSTPTRYEDTNLASLGVPNWEGLRPKNSWRLDKSDKVHGNETLVNQYDVNGLMVSIFSYNSQNYAFVVDEDWKKPIDLALYDTQGHGKFQRISPDTTISLPSWALKQ